MIALLIQSIRYLGVVFSFWIYYVVKKKGGNPWGWIVGTILIWPIFTFIVGLKYKNKGLVILGCVGLCYLLGLPLLCNIVVTMQRLKG